jgi:membrane associated rhomboid family serine protease
MSYDPNYTRIGFPRPTPAIGRLMAINIAVFVLNLVLGGRLSGGTGSGPWFGVSRELLFEGYGLGLLRLLTYQFTHSFTDPMHLIWNLLGLWFFGRIAEERLGRLGTYKLYLAGGLAGAVFHIGMYALLRGVDVPVVGASGACYALFLYAVCVAPRTEVILFFFPVQLIFLGVLFLGLALYSLVLELTQGMSGGVSDSAHLGGALLGLCAWKLDWFRNQKPWQEEPGLLDGVRAKWQQKRADAAARDAAALQAELDRILAKVHAEGLTSLTPAERAVLDQASKRAKARGER